MTRSDVVDGKSRDAPPLPSLSYPLEKPSSILYAASLSTSVPTDPTE